MASAKWNFCVFSLLLLTAVCEAQGEWYTPALDVSPTFYSKTCPQATEIVRKMIESILKENRNLVGGFQRLQFHDCWVNGCDGSVLLNSTTDNVSERDGFSNFLIRAIPEIDQIKEALEKVCPNTVSCADIIILAARDATIVAGGPSWPVALGRRDSRISTADEAEANLPIPNFNFSQLVENFARKNFSAREMVVLSGSHTVGRTHCNGIQPNLYNYTGILNLTNPNLDPKFAKFLKQKCPLGNTTNIVAMDRTKNLFDREYYKAILNHRGVFISDLALLDDSLGQEVVEELAKPGSSFFQEFADGMAKMSNLGLLTGTQGEIRRHCQFIN